MPATYDKIESQTLGSATSTVTFSSIPGTYTDLVIVMNAAASTYVNSLIRFNGDATANYSATRLYGNGTTASTARYTSETFSYVGDVTTDICTTIVQVQSYSNTTTYKTFLSRDSAATGGLGAWAGMWRKTPIAAITSLDLICSSGSTFTVGSKFTIYGIKAA